MKLLPAAQNRARIAFRVRADELLTAVCGTMFSGFEIDYVNRSGALTRIFVHQVEQDTFTVNGRTLVGTPYTFDTEVLFDSSGNVTHIFGSGLVETIRFRTEVCSSALVGWISRSIQALRSSCRPIWETIPPCNLEKRRNKCDKNPFVHLLYI